MNYLLGGILILAGLCLALRPCWLFRFLKQDCRRVSPACPQLQWLQRSGYLFCSLGVLGILSTLYFQH